VFETHDAGKIALCEWTCGCQIPHVKQPGKTGLPKSVSKRDLRSLKMALRQFAAERDWDQFHSPKNLAMALIGEAAEIVEHFQWLSEAQSKRLSVAKKREIQEELGDTLIYLVRLADKLNLDLLKAAFDKLQINRQKYPAQLVKGKAHKYTHYQR
jgi:NTP pyrophosphatase (non-canonical NTP hydrolase)